MDPRSVLPLIAALKDKDVNVRLSAAAGLGKIKDPRAVEPLIAVLKDTDVRVRRDAAFVLGEIGDARAVNALSEAFRNRDVEVIVGAHNFFIERGEPGSEDVLIRTLEESGIEYMADDFLSSGNAKLEEAAHAWGETSGHVLRGSGRVVWGSARQTPPEAPRN
jgi:hypothetical protein